MVRLRRPVEIGDGAGYGVTGFPAGQIAELDSVGGGNDAALSQTFQGGAAFYLVAFDFAGRSGVSPASNAFEVLFNGNRVTSIIPGSNAATRLSFLVAGNVGANTLTFHATDTPDGVGGIIDNVSVEAVPEPASFAALACGAAAFLRRRKRA